MNLIKTYVLTVRKHFLDNKGESFKYIYAETFDLLHTYICWTWTKV